MKTEVHLTKKAEKQLKKLPRFILEAFLVWLESVETDGIRNIRKLPGYHDEPLKGNRTGQRSVRLNKAYRVIYTEQTLSKIIKIEVIEVNNHEY